MAWQREPAVSHGHEERDGESKGQRETERRGRDTETDSGIETGTDRGEKKAHRDANRKWSPGRPRSSKADRSSGAASGGSGVNAGWL